jgi:hypothetical protein
MYACMNYVQIILHILFFSQYMYKLNGLTENKVFSGNSEIMQHIKSMKNTEVVTV